MFMETLEQSKIQPIRAPGCQHSRILFTLLASLLKLCLFWYPKLARGFPCNGQQLFLHSSNPCKTALRYFSLAHLPLKLDLVNLNCFAVVQEETFLMRNCLSVTWG